MILSFSGDQFLATRAARKALRDAGIGPGDLLELGEGLDAATVARQAGQGGLFGRVGLLLDFDAAFSGRAGTKPRNEAIDALERVPADSLVAVLDLSATPTRQKRYRELGEHRHLPTPRFGKLIDWVRDELAAAGVRHRRDVPQVLADLYGEDLPGLAGEINKLSVLDEELTGERVRALVGRPAARDAFDLIERVTSGDAGGALTVCESLLAQGEAPQRVLAALNWQFDQVARVVALHQDRGRTSEAEVASQLRIRPFVARKALAIASRLDEESLRAVLGTLLSADRDVKTGGNERWSLEELALRLSELFAGGRAAKRAAQP